MVGIHSLSQISHADVRVLEYIGGAAVVVAM